MRDRDGPSGLPSSAFRLPPSGERAELRILTIGPSDSSGATGIQADLRVFEALGCIGLCAVTDVLAAEGERVRRTFAVPPRVVEAQIDAAAGGGVDAVKLAAFRDRTLVEAVAERVRRRRLGPVVLDAGIVNPAGERVLGRNGIEWLRKRLLPRTALLVLRPAEVEILTGRTLESGDAETRREALEQVRRSGAEAVALSEEGDADLPGWVLDSSGLRSLGCTIPRSGAARDRFTAAVTVRLAAGDDVDAALHFARGMADG